MDIVPVEQDKQKVDDDSRDSAPDDIFVEIKRELFACLKPFHGIIQHLAIAFGPLFGVHSASDREKLLKRFND